jgi:hypothetical protein
MESYISPKLYFHLNEIQKSRLVTVVAVNREITKAITTAPIKRSENFSISDPT